MKFSKLKHSWVLLYFFIYMPWFIYLEERENTTNHYIIHSPLDDSIPFIEYFIIPYMLWFAFIAFFSIYFLFTDTKAFYSLAGFLIIGMTAFLVISTFFPTALDLRPYYFERDNIFVDMVRQLYRTDTPTNVLPSIHVFNTLGVCIAVKRCSKLKSHIYIKGITYGLSILIILSTMFLKQHSVTDVIAAFVLAGVVYQFVYARQDKKAPNMSQHPVLYEK